jgi:O-antigen/teichoic acid export membrane protein
MVRNSMWLLLNTGLQAGLGFVFWILAAHLFVPSAVGRATSLLSATTLIGYVALLGLNTTLIRYLPTSDHRDTLISSGVLLVGSFGALLAFGYALATPVFATSVAFLAHHALFVVGFVLMGAAAAINLITDAVFIAFRRAEVNALVDGGIGGLTKLLLLPVTAASGAYGLYLASVGGFAVAAIASLILFWTLLHVRPRLRGTLAVMRPLLRFSGANYLGGVFTLAPALVVPLIVLARLGASTAAYYYVAFQLANLVFAGGYAVTQTFLAEGGHGEEELKTLTRRAARMLAITTLPACLVVAVGAPVLLDLFGRSYSSRGTDVLILMSLAAIPVAALNWLVTILRLFKQLAAVALSNGVYAFAVCGLSWVLAPHGLSFVGVAWLGGALIGAAFAAIAVAFGSGAESRHHDSPNRGRSSAAAHRRLRSRRRTERRRTGQADHPTGLFRPSPSGYRLMMTEGPGDVDTIAAPDRQDIGLSEIGLSEIGVSDIDDVSDIDASAKGTRGRRWPLVAAAVVVLIGISFATPAGRHQWAVSFIRQPTPYTVLSFENAGHLPTTLSSGGHLELTFAVTNHEGRDVRYRYLVTSASSGQIPVVLQRSILAVPEGVRQTESVSVVPTCQGSPCRVQVSLPGPAESIEVQVELRNQSS